MSFAPNCITTTSAPLTEAQQVSGRGYYARASQYVEHIQDTTKENKILSSGKPKTTEVDSSRSSQRFRESEGGQTLVCLATKPATGISTLAPIPTRQHKMCRPLSQTQEVTSNMA